MRSLIRLCGISGWLVLPGMLLLVALCWAGCQGLNFGEIESPLAYQQQQQKILEIVPVGTPRSEAVEKLTAAGVFGEFSQGEKIYYCGSWKQANGSRWRTNVAVLFDEEGKVYRTQPIEAGVGFSTSASTSSSENEEPATSIAEPVRTSGADQPVNTTRSGLRRPFDE